MCLEEIVKCVSGGERDEKNNEDVETLLNMFTNNFIEIRPGMVKGRPHD